MDRSLASLVQVFLVLRGDPLFLMRVVDPRLDSFLGIGDLGRVDLEVLVNGLVGLGL